MFTFSPGGPFPVKGMYSNTLLPSSQYIQYFNVEFFTGKNLCNSIRLLPAP